VSGRWETLGGDIIESKRHFRSDGERGIRLGEQVAVRFLQDHLREYLESEFGGAFAFTSRDGNRVEVTADSVTVN
jgi:hypothetical protein